MTRWRIQHQIPSFPLPSAPTRKCVACFSLSEVAFVSKTSFTEGNNRNIISLKLTSNEGSSTLWSLGFLPVKQGALIPSANFNCSNNDLNLFFSPVLRPLSGNTCQPRCAGQDRVGQYFFRSPFIDPSPG